MRTAARAPNHLIERAEPAYPRIRRAMRDEPVTFPEDLQPRDDVEVLLSTGRKASIRRYGVSFTPCMERPTIGMDRVYSAKQLVLVDKQATFPEIALLGIFQRHGWQGAWSDNPHHKYFDRMPNQSKGISLDTYANQTVARIAENNDKSKAGCWDLILWSERRIVFVAVVPASPAAQFRGVPLKGDVPGVGDAQVRWMTAALRTGFSAGQFVMVEWDHRRVAARRRRHGGPGLEASP